MPWCLLQAFGSPWIVAHVGGEKEVFFGNDRMELLAETLGESYSNLLTHTQIQHGGAGVMHARS